MESEKEVGGHSEDETEGETCSSFLGECSKAASTSKQSEIEEQNKEEYFKLNKSDFVILQFRT